MRLGGKYPDAFFICCLAGGLVLRVALALCFEPMPRQLWFGPFLDFTLAHPSPDPWSSWLQVGNAMAFPYGITMLVALLPFSWFSLMVGFSGLGISLTIIVADLGVMFLLGRLLPNRRGILLLFWWFSPLVLCINYWVGQLDCLPVGMMLAGIFFLKEKRFRLAGLACAMAVSAKCSMALSLPFILLFFLRNRRMWPVAGSFFSTFLPAVLVLLGLPLLSSGYRDMVMGTAELQRFFDLSLPLGGHKLYLTPLLYLLAVYAAWRVPFLSFALLIAFMALGSMIVILGTATPPGWQLWFWPFLIVLEGSASNSQRTLCFLFSCLAAATAILFWPAPVNVDLSLPLSAPNLYDVLQTLLLCMGAVIIVGILRNGIRKNTVYRFGQRISVAIAGDSGVGKDTLASALTGILGEENTLHISGDDYHRWDRASTSWHLQTHLNPRANDLFRLFNDIIAILSGKSINMRHYRHTDGRFSSVFKESPRRFLLVSGLHTLFSQAMSRNFNVRVFIEMDDTLRAWFKCRRDTTARNQSLAVVQASMSRRKRDSVRYIEPQSRNADIVFSRRLAHDQVAVGSESAVAPSSFLVIRLRQSIYHESLIRSLICLCGLYVDVAYPHTDEVVITVDGNIKGEDMALIASRHIPELEEMATLQPDWKDGPYGLMQLVTLLSLFQNLRSNA